MRGWQVLVSCAILAALGTLVGCRHTGRSTGLDRTPPQSEVEEQSWPDGTLRLRREVVAGHDGMRVDNGTYTRWHRNGRKAYEATFRMGKKVGPATMWHENGRKWVEEFYVDGERHGPRYVWDENGKKRKEEHFFEGKPDGTWIVWNDKGDMKSEIRFDHGEPAP